MAIVPHAPRDQTSCCGGVGERVVAPTRRRRAAADRPGEVARRRPLVYRFGAMLAHLLWGVGLLVGVVTWIGILYLAARGLRLLALGVVAVLHAVRESRAAAARGTRLGLDRWAGEQERRALERERRAERRRRRARAAARPPRRGIASPGARSGAPSRRRAA
jgi:hypothetical protein